MKERSPLDLPLQDIAQGEKDHSKKSLFCMTFTFNYWVFLDWKAWIFSQAVLARAVGTCTLRRVHLG